MAAILKLWHHIRKLTQKISVYLLEEQSYQISFWSDFKWCSLRLSEQVVPTTRRRATATTTKRTKKM